MKGLQIDENSLCVRICKHTIHSSRYINCTTLYGAFYNETSRGLSMSASPLYEQVPDMIESGYVHPPPPGCPRAVYKVMIQCW